MSKGFTVAVLKGFGKIPDSWREFIMSNVFKDSLSKVLLKRLAGIGSREQVEGFILKTVLHSSSLEMKSKLVRLQ